MPGRVRCSAERGARTNAVPGRVGRAAHPGLGVRDGVHLILGETPDDFVDAAIMLMRDPGRANALARRARAYAVECFSWQAIVPRVRDAIAGLEA